MTFTGKGATTSIRIEGNGCHWTITGMKTLETLAASIYRALGHEPMWLKSKETK